MSLNEKYNVFPPPSSQLSYLLTGALAGFSTLPIEYTWQRFSSPKLASSLRLVLRNAPPTIYRGAIRFYTFDLTRHNLSHHLSLPVSLTGALSGAAGGFAEVCAQSLVNRHVLRAANLATQSARLFLCFGSYTYLSTSLSPEQLPPKPFWKCWLMGAAAGGLGSGIVARLEEVKMGTLWRVAVPRGAVTIGTVIAVQVSSCAELSQWGPIRELNCTPSQDGFE